MINSLSRPIVALLIFIPALCLAGCKGMASFSTPDTNRFSTPANASVVHSSTRTFTPTPSLLPTFVAYSTATYPEGLFSIQLSDIILRLEELPVNSLDYPNVKQPVEYNLTNEIQEQCALDCVKVVWLSEIDSHKLIITMMRMPSPFSANEAVVKTWSEFSQVAQDVGFEKGEIYYPDDLPANSVVGIKYGETDVEYIFVGSRGPVVIAINYQFKVEMDLFFDFGAIEHLAILQVQKLINANYPE